MKRLENLSTLKVDPGSKATFDYRGRPMTGLAGDTVASALFANGVRIFSRSHKYHRPRGLYSLDGEAGTCLLRVDGLPNVRGETTFLTEGQKIEPQNVWGSPEKDLLGILNYFDWAMPAGFYYRLFHKPYQLWPYFMKIIRKLAGLGRFNPDWRAKPSDGFYLNAEVCVLGGGPAGMSTALAAADCGLRVVLLEQRPWLGGFYDWRTRSFNGRGPLHRRGAELAASVESHENIRVFKRAFVNGLWGRGQVTGFLSGGADDSFAERYFEVRADSVVAATGCLERPLIFENNDLPGIMQSGCAHRLARTFGLLPGRRAVFCVGHDLGLEAALDLFDLGLKVAAVADLRTSGHDPELAAGLEERKIEFLPGWTAGRASGFRSIREVVLTGPDHRQNRTFECDLLVAAAGLTPANGALFLARTDMVFDESSVFFLPDKMPPGVLAAGRVLGFELPEAVELSGRRAGLAAALAAGIKVEAELEKAEAALKEFGRVSGSPYAAGWGEGKKSFVCFDEDVTVKHIRQACDLGFDAPELAKRFTAAGTGPSQGGVPGHNLPLVMADLIGREQKDIRPTTIRPPLVPTLFSTYAGRRHDIYKRTPLHDLQEKEGGIFRRVGVWKRARYFSRDFTSRDEIMNVRENVGMIDVSTLGKFRLFGPDARKMLDRVYVGDMSKTPSGKVKYSAMVNEDGCLLDDGVVTKIAENDYYFTTSTGRAGQTAEWLRYHSRYDNWDFNLVNLTDSLAAINLAGPRARDVLAGITDADISHEAFPFMGYREFQLKDKVPVRVMRLGFVGELSYEMHVPSSLASCVWQWLAEAGKEFGLKNFGLEAQGVLRLEKGHVIIGQESEIRTSLHDLGLGFLWARDKKEARTVGAAALKITENQENRLKLVGIQMDDPRKIPGDGAIIVDETIRGFVCTARYSFCLQRGIGLALVDRPLSAAGTELSIFQENMGSDRFKATVVETPFYDPEGRRLKM